jgi:hypothetical protein
MIDLKKLSEPFPASDIEWRVARAGPGKKGIYCRVVAYITARAIQQRLDDVCGPENWRLEEPRILTINGKSAFACGLSIRIINVEFTDAWVTKWDVAEPTNIEPAKGGWSGAVKRSGAAWSIGRYLYHLEESFAETSETDPGARGWHYAKLSEKQGGAEYYWKEPTLPAWALPKEEESEVSSTELNKLKLAWKAKFAPDVKNRADLVEGFSRFVTSIVGEFPASDHTTWTQDALEKCRARINQTTDPKGVSAEIPFDSK